MFNLKSLETGPARQWPTLQSFLTSLETLDLRGPLPLELEALWSLFPKLSTCPKLT